MTARAWGGVFLWATAASALAQGVPVPAAGAAREAATSAVQAETVVVPASRDIPDSKAASRPSGANTGVTRRPMDIRLHDGGIKLPKCTEESREGLACK